MNGKRAVVVTGASSGIGEATALRLASDGFQVFAGVRRESDGERMVSAGAGNIEAIRIDVTDPDSIGHAERLIRLRIGEVGLYGLVNNAGIGIPGPIEHFPIDDLRRQLEVNVVGQVAVVQAFLPLIRAAAGRIVTIGSVGDGIAMPFGGALCASKGAIRLINDALRLELASSGIRVILVRPASIHTPAVERMERDIARVIDALPQDGLARYGDAMRAFARKAVERESHGSPPAAVATVVSRALTSRRPATRYRAGKDSGLLTFMPRILPDRALDAVRRRLFGLAGFTQSEQDVHG